MATLLRRVFALALCVSLVVVVGLRLEVLHRKTLEDDDDIFLSFLHLPPGGTAVRRVPFPSARGHTRKFSPNYSYPTCLHPPPFRAR